MRRMTVHYTLSVTLRHIITHTGHTPEKLIYKYIIHPQILSPHVSMTPKTTVKHHRTRLFPVVGKP